ncbi:MAG: hypothetical protein K8S14_06825 [Actinomycetia bacterium]|nr:hypothetical protein [Actinomycetes bacterium]
MAKDMMIKRHIELEERLEVERAQIAAQELQWPDASVSAAADAALRGVFHDPRVIEYVARIDRLQACCHLLEHLEWLMDNLSNVPSTSLESDELRQWLVPRFEALAKDVNPVSYPDALRRYRAFTKLFAVLATLDSWQSFSSSTPFHNVYHR